MGGQGASRELRHVAKTFSELQEGRHRADYDLSELFSRPEVLAAVNEAELAFRAWESVRGSDEGNVFLAALLFQKRWNR